MWSINGNPNCRKKCYGASVAMHTHILCSTSLQHVHKRVVIPCHLCWEREVNNTKQEWHASQSSCLSRDQHWWCCIRGHHICFRMSWLQIHRWVIRVTFSGHQKWITLSLHQILSRSILCQRCIKRACAPCAPPPCAVRLVTHTGGYPESSHTTCWTTTSIDEH